VCYKYQLGELLGASMRFGRLTGLLVLMIAGLTSCSQQQTKTADDVRTAGRHLSRGIRALFGDMRDSRLVSSADVFAATEASRGYELAPGAEEIVGLQEDAFAAAPEIVEDGGAIPSIDAFRDPSVGELAQVFQKIQFETDSSKIEGTGPQKTVKAIAKYLQSHPKTLVYIEGHCDERGPSLYNLSLGSRRANAIRTALIKEGVESDRLLTISYGKERPLSLGSDPEGWRQNRRGQFKVYNRGE
jgi:peptidoglycan-associated lipoprotein